MNPNIHPLLLKKIEPNVLALIWITEKGITSPFYGTLHYLFEGLPPPSPSDHMNIFETMSYGHKLFLLQTTASQVASHFKPFEQIVDTAYFDQAGMIVLLENLSPDKAKTLIPPRLKTRYRLTILDHAPC